MTWQLKLKIQDETKEKKEGGEWLIIKRRVSIGKRQITPGRRTELLIKNVGKMLEKCWRKMLEKNLRPFQLSAGEGRRFVGAEQKK